MQNSTPKEVLLLAGAGAGAAKAKAKVRARSTPLPGPGLERQAAAAQNAALASCTTAAVHCQWHCEKRL